MNYLIDTHYLLWSLPEQILTTSLESGFKIYDISEDDIATSHQLPFVANHRDPFDRFLVWQCIRNDIILVSADIRLKAYIQYGLKIA